jgi:hypothetical protein
VLTAAIVVVVVVAIVVVVVVAGSVVAGGRVEAAVVVGVAGALTTGVVVVAAVATVTVAPALTPDTGANATTVDVGDVAGVVGVVTRVGVVDCTVDGCVVTGAFPFAGVWPAGVNGTSVVDEFDAGLLFEAGTIEDGVDFEVGNGEGTMARVPETFRFTALLIVTVRSANEFGWSASDCTTFTDFFFAFAETLRDVATLRGDRVTALASNVGTMSKQDVPNVRIARERLTRSTGEKDTPDHRPVVGQLARQICWFAEQKPINLHYFNDYSQSTSKENARSQAVAPLSMKRCSYNSSSSSSSSSSCLCVVLQVSPDSVRICARYDQTPKTKEEVMRRLSAITTIFATVLSAAIGFGSPADAQSTSTAVTVTGVITQNGSPLAGVGIEIGNLDNGSFATATSTADGAFRTTVQTGRSLVGVGLINGETRHRSLLVVDITPPVPPATTVSLPAITLNTRPFTIVLKNADGTSGSANVAVNISEPLAPGVQGHDYAFRGVVTGSRTIDVFASPGGSLTATETVGTLVLASRPINTVIDNTVTLVLPPVSVTSGRVLIDGDPVSNANVEFFGPNGLSQIATDRAGNYSTRLVAGQYQLTVDAVAPAKSKLATPPIETNFRYSNSSIAIDAGETKLPVVNFKTSTQKITIPTPGVPLFSSSLLWDGSFSPTPSETYSFHVGTEIQQATEFTVPVLRIRSTDLSMTLFRPDVSYISTSTIVSTLSNDSYRILLLDPPVISRKKEDKK